MRWTAIVDGRGRIVEQYPNGVEARTRLAARQAGGEGDPAERLVRLPKGQCASFVGLIPIEPRQRGYRGTRAERRARGLKRRAALGLPIPVRVRPDVIDAGTF